MGNNPIVSPPYLKTLVLDGACPLDPGPDVGGGFPRDLAGDLRVLHGGDLDMNVDPVQERAADALTVLEDLAGAASAEPFQIPGVAARTWMRCLFARQH